MIPPSSPFVSIAPNTGRLPRTFQWSVGFQREITRNLVVDAAYVGNRGAWWVSPLLSSLNYNALTPQELLSQYGLNVQNRADTTLLNTQINSPAVIARFPCLANPNNVYPGFPKHANAASGAAAISAVERHSAVPGASRWKYLVRLAAGQVDQALFARPERAGWPTPGRRSLPTAPTPTPATSRPHHRSSTTCSTSRWTSRFPGSASRRS